MTVANSVTTATNQDFVATITPNKPDVTITNNGGSPSYMLTENGSFTFELADQAGNKGTVTMTVDNINKTSPTATVAYRNDINESGRCSDNHAKQARRHDRQQCRLEHLHLLF